VGRASFVVAAVIIQAVWQDGLIRRRVDLFDGTAGEQLRQERGGGLPGDAYRLASAVRKYLMRL
jgi:hypothetical protein